MKRSLIVLILLCVCSKKQTQLPEVDFAPAVVEAAKSTPKPEKKKAVPIEITVSDETPNNPVVVYFDFDKANLKPREATKLNFLLGKNYKPSIRGFTCKFGTDEYNMGLSLRRADIVSKYIGAGVPIAFGENYCRAACNEINELECRQCRKVEVWFK